MKAADDVEFAFEFHPVGIHDEEAAVGGILKVIFSETDVVFRNVDSRNRSGERGQALDDAAVTGANFKDLF